MERKKDEKCCKYVNEEVEVELNYSKKFDTLLRSRGKILYFSDAGVYITTFRYSFFFLCPPPPKSTLGHAHSASVVSQVTRNAMEIYKHEIYQQAVKTSSIITLEMASVISYFFSFFPSTDASMATG